MAFRLAWISLILSVKLAKHDTAALLITTRSVARCNFRIKSLGTPTVGIPLL